jgi:heme-degrading monooxygenase HmoA
MECIVLIRRFIKPARAEEFVRWMHGQPAVTAPGFLGKTLTRVASGADLPPGLTGFQIAGNPGCETFVMVDRWASVEAFRAYVPKASTADQDDFEAWPRQRVILPVA